MEYIANGKTVQQSEHPSGEADWPTGNSQAAAVYTYVVGYDRSAPQGEQVEQVDVVADIEP